MRWALLAGIWLLGHPNDPSQVMPIRELAPGTIEVRDGRLRLTSIAAGGKSEDVGWVAVAVNWRPVAWIDMRVSADEQAIAAALQPPGERGELRAWLIRRDVVAWARRDWPAGVELSAKLEALGPGRSGVWLDAGALQGVRAGDYWWVQVGAQPVARLETRFVGREASWCRIVPLTGEMRLTGGMMARLWPNPAAARDGRAYSAVCLVERSEGSETVWVAAPPACAVPAEPRVEFYRGGQFVGSGLVERWDERFWHVRTTTAVEGGVRVGDQATIRTLADIAAKRFTAHVIGEAGGRAVIDAGEAEGVSAGDRCWLGQADAAVELEVTRVTGGYSEVRAARGPAPGRGSAVRFGPVPPYGREVGILCEVWGEHLFRAEVTQGPPPATAAVVGLAGTSDTRVAAMVLASDVTQILGFVLPTAEETGPAAGDRVLVSPD